MLLILIEDKNHMPFHIFCKPCVYYDLLTGEQMANVLVSNAAPARAAEACNAVSY
jgi:hypothetical protein